MLIYIYIHQISTFYYFSLPGTKKRELRPCKVLANKKGEMAKVVQLTSKIRACTWPPFRTLTCPWPAFGSHWLEPPIHLQDVPVVYAQTLLQALHKVQEGILSIGSSPKSLPLWDLSKLHAGHQSRLATCGAVPPCAACWVASAL